MQNSFIEQVYRNKFHELYNNLLELKLIYNTEPTPTPHTVLMSFKIKEQKFYKKYNISDINNMIELLPSFIDYDISLFKSFLSSDTPNTSLLTQQFQYKYTLKTGKNLLLKRFQLTNYIQAITKYSPNNIKSLDIIMNIKLQPLPKEIRH